MSNDICIWKSNNKFSNDKAGSIYGQLAEGGVKPEEIDASEKIQQFVTAITKMYPPLEKDPAAIWASSFSTSEWHCLVSLSYNNEDYVDIFIEIVEVCSSMGLTLYDSGAGDVFPS